LFTQVLIANTGKYGYGLFTPIGYTKIPLRFKSYGNYLEYSRIKTNKGIDAANDFYTTEFKKLPASYIDYLPLTAGSSFPLTGSLDILMAGNNQFLKLEASSSGTGYVHGIVSNSGGNTLFGTDRSSGGALITGSLPYASIFTSIGATAVQFGTDQVARMTILPSSGNVGIGTTNPTAKLEVNGSTTINGDLSFDDAARTITNNLAGTFRLTNPADAGQMVLNAGTTSGYYAQIKLAGNSHASAGLQFITGGSERMSVLSNGNLGIGTSSPSEKLVIGGINSTNNNDQNALLFTDLGGNTLGKIGSRRGINGYDGALMFYTPDATTSVVTERMRINSVGNIGIGSISPSEKLVIGGINSTNNNDQNSILFTDLGGNTLGKIGSRRGVNGYDGTLIFYTPDGATAAVTERMRINSFGNIGIGTASASEKLSVNGNISAKKLIVTQTGWSDYVFDKDYKLRSLSSLETFINQNKHLPDIPSAKEVEEKGISVGDNQALLLKKIEELTLYMIEMNKKIEVLQNENLKLKKQIGKK
jgi:hypothetical protein